MSSGRWKQGSWPPGLAVISEQDVLGDRLIGKPRRKRKAENFLREVDTLSPGDLVVHVEHGVGPLSGARDDHGAWRAA